MTWYEINETDINNKNCIMRNTKRKEDKITRLASANNLFKNINDLANSSSQTFLSQDSSISEKKFYERKRILESSDFSFVLNLLIDHNWWN